jgi:glycosyltransferase involved in cell wall biosynthesis
MENKNRKAKIAIIGPYPPPYGGISIYIKRIINYLEKNHIECIIYNESKIVEYENIINIKPINSYKKFIFRIPFLKYDILHFHSTNLKIHMLLGCYKFFGKKILLTVHGESWFSQLAKLNLVGHYLLLLSLRNIDKIICVNPRIKKELLYLGFDSKKIEVIPAFIDPTSDEIDIKQLPEFFHKIRHKHKILITANAFRVSFYKNQDLYGIDLSIELMKSLIDNGHKNIGFIYVIPDIGDYDYFKNMQNLVKKYNLEDYFHFYTKPVAYPAVINMCDLFIRPTNTDGDALSIREAILLRRPAIASDVCKRPEGTILFKNRKVDDLYNKVIYIIENYTKCKKQIEGIEFEDNAEKILEVYKKVLNGK